MDERSAELIVVDSDDMVAQPVYPAAAVNDSDRLTRAADGIVLTVINSVNMAAQPLHSADTAIESDQLTCAAANVDIIAQKIGDFDVNIDNTSIPCISYVTSDTFVNADAEPVDVSITEKRMSTDAEAASHLFSNSSDRLTADESIILRGCRMEDLVVERMMAADQDGAVADHSFFQNRSFTAIGSANTQVHAHPLGLAHVVFDNCVVKVRLGSDLDRLIALSRIGPVSLHNIQSSGWITTRETLLPAYVFLRWISSMVAVEL